MQRLQRAPRGSRALPIPSHTHSNPDTRHPTAAHRTNGAHRRPPNQQELIEQLHEQKRRAEEQVQRLKYTSSKPGASRRPNARTGGGGEGVNDAQAKYERMRNKHEHMKSVFLSVRSGIGNIARQLDADRLFKEVPLESMGAKEMALLLEEIEQRAQTLLEAIDLEEEAIEAAAAVMPAQPAAAGAGGAGKKLGGPELELGPGNIRIKDPTEREDDAQDGARCCPAARALLHTADVGRSWRRATDQSGTLAQTARATPHNLPFRALRTPPLAAAPCMLPTTHADDDFEEDLEEDVVDRETLKKQSASILDKANKGKKKRRRRNVAAADEA